MVSEEEIVPSPSPIRLLRGRVNAWVRGRLWLQVVIGLFAGLFVGFMLGPEMALVQRGTADLVTNWFALPGTLFLGLIGMVLIPLVVSSIIHGLSSTTSPTRLRSIGLRLAVYVLLTTTAAAALGITLALVVEPGALIKLPGATAAAPPSATAPATTLKNLPGQVPDLIAGLVPQNLTESILERDMLAIVTFAILIGIACVFATRTRVEPFLNLLEAVLEVSMTVVKWAMFLAPWAVFGLMAQLVARVGANTVFGLAAYVLTVFAGLLILYIGYLLLVAVFGGIKVSAFARAIGGVQLLAFSTSSSTAVMPVSIQTAVSKLGVQEPTAGLVIPLGATVNMAGTALYQAIAVIFLSQMSGIDLSIGQLSLIVLTLVASSIGSPGTPGVGIVILSNIVGDFGIPTAGLVLILGVDRILDMARTAVNVTGDLTACVLLQAREPASGGET